MRKIWWMALASVLWLAPVRAQHEGHGGHSGHGASEPKDKPQITTVTMKVSGLHCAGCSRAVEDALITVVGVKTAQVSLKDKSAVVAYQEDKTSVQQIARTIAQTPSPMPQGKFDAALLLNAKGVRSNDDAQRLGNALKGVKGVKQVEVSPTAGVAAVTFEEKPAVRLSDLTTAAEKAGFGIAPLSPKDVRKAAADDEESTSQHDGHGSHARQGGGCCGK